MAIYTDHILLPIGSGDQPDGIGCKQATRIPHDFAGL